MDMEWSGDILVWIDRTAVTDDTKTLCDFIRKETGLYVSATFGGNGKGYIRINYACPKTRLEDSLQRLKQGIEAFISGLNRQMV